MAVDTNAQLLTATFQNWRYAPEPDEEPSHSNLPDDLGTELTSSVQQNGEPRTLPVPTDDQHTQDDGEISHSHESAATPRLEETPPAYTERSLPPTYSPPMVPQTTPLQQHHRLEVETVDIGALQPSISEQPRTEFVSSAGPIILSCLTTWIFGILFGVVAYAFAS